jgi:hypothetical protein
MNFLLQTVQAQFYSPLIDGSTVLCWALTVFFFSFVILYAFGRIPWTGDQPVARPLSTHRRTQTLNKRTQPFMLRVRFEPTTPEFERAKTVHALDRVATVIGPSSVSQARKGNLIALLVTCHVLQNCLLRFQQERRQANSN